MKTTSKNGPNIPCKLKIPSHSLHLFRVLSSHTILLFETTPLSLQGFVTVHALWFSMLVYIMDAQGDMNFHMNLVRSVFAVMVLGSTACGRGLHPGSLSHFCHKVWATVAQTVGFFPLYALPLFLSSTGLLYLFLLLVYLLSIKFCKFCLYELISYF